MKKVMIFYGSYGGGHLSAAKSIKEYLENNYPDIEIQMIDCIEYVNKVVNKITTKAYSELVKNASWAWGFVYKKSEHGPIAKISNNSNKIMSIKLNKLIKKNNPDIVISTHPFSSQMCAYLKKKHKINFKLASIITDYALHEQWLLYHEEVNYYFVAYEKLKNDLIESGISSDTIFSTGIPVSGKFLKKYNNEEILKEFNLLPNKKNILFFAGGEYGLGKNKTFEIFKILAENFNDIQIIAIAGKNEEMKNKFIKLVEHTKREDAIKVLEFTDKVAEIMSISNLVITKPGGLTTTESLVSGLPIIAINPIPGQEENNAKFIEKNNVGIWLKKDDNIFTVLSNIINDNEKLEMYKKNTKLISKIDSTENICKIIIEK